MNQFDERVHLLQKQMVKDNIQAYLIPSTDPHLSEEACSHFTYPKYYFCAFKGNDGTVLITQDHYYLFTDGRYWTEAEIELKGTECILMKAGAKNVPTIPQFIKKNDLYPLGMDASLFSLNDVRSFYIDNNHPIKSISYFEKLEGLPSLPKGKIWKLSSELLSTTREERILSVLKDGKEKGAESLLYTALDDISYLLGYRGNDIPYTPVFYSYLFIDKNGVSHLFIDLDKIPADFNEDKIVLHPYEEVFSFLKAREEKIGLDYKKANALIVKSIAHPLNILDKAAYDKAVKGEKEISNTKRIHELDGLQVLKLQKFIEENVKDGLDEEKCAEYIDKQRLNQAECFDLSFETIAACDSNAAMMHYAPTKENHAPLTSDNQLLLVDSGGQYYGGTTDITRTFLVNPKPDPEIVHDYTLTLKSQIALSRVIFEKGCSGHSIDIVAREVMWKEGLDYKCGTGHGVSYIGPVHEGPIGFRYYTRPGVIDDGILTPGHIITIEPGVYKDYKHGIRLENELLVVPAFENDQGIFYRFETITYCPYDRRGIDLNMLDDEELSWLNDYLKTVEEKLTPLCIDDASLLQYLKKQCAPFER